MNIKWPLIISSTLSVMLSVVILGMPFNTECDTATETATLPLETEASDNFTVKDAEPVKVGNFDARERIIVTLPETTETEETTTAAPTTTEAETTEEETTLTAETESIQEAIPETTEESTEAEQIESRSHIYSCHGAVLDPDLQRYAYSVLSEFGMEEYFPVWVCECYQESSYQPSQRTLNHGHWDCGLMQIRETYWDEFQEGSGVFGDILDPYTNIRVSIWILAQYWNLYDGNVAETISHYMSGWGGEYMEQYVDDVLGHMEYLEVIE